MSKSVNKAILIGNLGGDPELRHTGNGTPVCTFTVATNESWKDKGGQQVERVEWHTVVAWRQLADICAEYLRKGHKVYIEGKIQTRSWDDNSGVKHYKTEIVADEMVILSGEDHAARPAYQPESKPRPANPPADKNDDLPF